MYKAIDVNATPGHMIISMAGPQVIAIDPVNDPE